MIYSEPANKARLRIRSHEVRTCVVGLGTVGLPLAAHLATAGFRVQGLDISSERIKRIKDGSLLFEYPELLKKAVRSGRFSPTLDAEEALGSAEVVFVCVPTGLRPDKDIDTRNLVAATDTIAAHMRKGMLIVLESTMAIGTTRAVADALEKRSGLKKGVDFGIAHCPERYNPALPFEALPTVFYGGRPPKHTEYTYHKIDRVVGGLDTKSAKLAREVYLQFLDAGVTPLSSIEAAEATKLLENIFRDVNIALVNEMAQVFSRIGLDVYEVIDAAKTKPFAFLPHYPGPGVGGECIPVVPWFLMKQAEANGVTPKLMRAAREVNDSMPSYVVELVESGLKEHGRVLRGSKVTILGLAYKKNTLDARLSPAVKIMDILKARECSIVICDPIMEGTAGPVALTSPAECFKGSDAIVLVTDHDFFSGIDFSSIKKEMRTPLVVDCRHFFDGEKLSSLGFSYRGVGVPAK